MKIDIYDQTRKHLIAFLKKLLQGNYTRSEFENFIIIGYQDEVFERIRTKVVEIINVKSARDQSSAGALNAENRAAIEEIVGELERQGV